MEVARRVLGIPVVIGVAIAVAAGLAACTPSGSSPVDTAAESPVATSVVDLPPSYRFEPDSIVVAAGTAVTWTNHDNFTHSVQFVDGDLPTAPLLMQPGASATFTFTAPGTHRYLCHLHPQNMRGAVTVTP